MLCCSPSSLEVSHGEVTCCVQPSSDTGTRTQRLASNQEEQRQKEALSQNEGAAPGPAEGNQKAQKTPTDFSERARPAAPHRDSARAQIFYTRHQQSQPFGPNMSSSTARAKIQTLLSNYFTISKSLKLRQVCFLNFTSFSPLSASVESFPHANYKKAFLTLLHV